MYELFYRVNESDPWTLANRAKGKFDGLVELPTTLQFKARYMRLSMSKALVKVYPPDSIGVKKSEKPMFSVLDFHVTTHPGGGGMFGLQSLDGRFYNTFAWGLREPGQWVLASEREIFTKDLEEPPEFQLETWVHFALTFETVVSTPTTRSTRITIYRNGEVFGEPYVRVQPFDRLTKPNETRIVIGVRSSAHDVEDANLWPPSESRLHGSFKESTTAESWPSEDDTVKHGSSHSSYFDGYVRDVSLIRTAIGPEELRGVYLERQLGCHCYDACPTGVNRFFPEVQVPCSGQGVCRRPDDGRPLGIGYCECLQGYSGQNCQDHCSELSSIGCCEVDDDCPADVSCNQDTKACGESPFWQ